MERSPETIASLLNASVKALNLHTIASPDAWSALIGDYFAHDGNGTDESDDESGDSDVNPTDDQESQCAALSLDTDNASLVTALETDEPDSQTTDTDEPDTDEPVVCVDESPALIHSLNLVCEDKDAEQVQIKNFQCKCKYNDGQPCYSHFMPESVLEYRLQINALAKHEKDLVILAQISAHIQRSEYTQASRRKSQKLRTVTRVLYFHEGNEICRDMFKFLHCISQDKLTALIAWFKENGVCPRQYRSGGRVKKQALTYEDVTHLVNFVLNYAATNALVLPGRVPGFKRSDLKLLPSCDTKASIWRLYHTTMIEQGHRAVKLSGFRSLWRQLLPFVIVTRPMTDLCWKCQDNNSRIYKSANLSEDQKSDTLKEQEEHLRVVRLERSLYQSQVAQCKAVVNDLNLALGVNQPCSRNIAAHYSFDFAQQVFYPNDPLQPGPIYFLTPRKCALFGVCCEGIPQQVNFLIDEASSIGKGSNSVISYLDFFFDNFALGECEVHLHADNCSGQNKNNFMLWYLIWRTIHKFHQKVFINFLIAGHTKFAPDWCFGLLKQKYRRTPVSCLKDIAGVVQASTLSSTNLAQMVGDENGTQFVPTRDWHIFFNGFFKTLAGIKSYQHFRCDSDYPGVIFYKTHADCEELQVNLLKNVGKVPTAERPNPVRIPGLDAARRKYLYEKIRPFVREDVRDLVCPPPNH